MQADHLLTFSLCTLLRWEPQRSSGCYVSILRTVAPTEVILLQVFSTSTSSWNNHVMHSTTHDYSYHFFFTHQVTIFLPLRLTLLDYTHSSPHPLSFHQTPTMRPQHWAPGTQKHDRLYFWGVPSWRSTQCQKRTLRLLISDFTEAGSKSGRRAHGTCNLAKEGFIEEATFGLCQGSWDSEQKQWVRYLDVLLCYKENVTKIRTEDE